MDTANIAPHLLEQMKEKTKDAISDRDHHH